MKLIYLAFASVLLAGCGNDEFQDLQDFVKNSGVGMRGKIEPPPDVKPYEPFPYNNENNLPDPFKPRKLVPQPGNIAGTNQPDMDRPKEALEEFPLEALKMVGYLFQNKVGYAVIRTPPPDSKLHRVKAGNHMGLNFGLIKEVNETAVLVSEMMQDSTGGWTERISTVQLLE